MTRRLFLLPLCALLLAGCHAAGPPPKSAQELLAEQPIDDTHDAFLVETGGRLGTLLVTAERTAEEPAFEIHFAVWDPAGPTQPIQTMNAPSHVFHWKETVDANFDGHPDFGYMYAMGNQPTYWNFWIWDEERGQFISEPELSRISCPVFDSDTGTISGWARGSAAGDGQSTFHQWVDGELVCVRQIDGALEHDGSLLLTVQDRVDGRLTEVYRGEFLADTDGYAEARRKWEDFPGEETTPKTF